MPAGYSRIRIFSPLGYQLAEVDAMTRRGWVLNEPGRCEFTLPIYDAFAGGFNAKMNGGTFAFGNYVLIDHKPSVNADGSSNGVLPQWVGILATPRQWAYGKITFTALSAEYVLQLRATPTDYIAQGSPGQIFAQIITWANDQSYNPGGYPIRLGAIDLSGPVAAQVMKVSCLEEVRTLYKANGYDWDIQPSLDANNRLSLIANWYQRKGVQVFRYFTNLNMMSADPILTEQGQWYNTIRSYSEASSTGNRNFTLVQDAASLAANGLANLNQVWPGTDGAVSAVGTQVVYNKGLAFITANKKPVTTFVPAILDSGNDFSYLNIGNFWFIQTDIAGFLPNGSIGTNGLARITAMEYQELYNRAVVAAVVQ